MMLSTMLTPVVYNYFDRDSIIHCYLNEDRFFVKIWWNEQDVEVQDFGQFQFGFRTCLSKILYMIQMEAVDLASLKAGDDSLEFSMPREKYLSFEAGFISAYNELNTMYEDYSIYIQNFSIRLTVHSKLKDGDLDELGPHVDAITTYRFSDDFF